MTREEQESRKLENENKRIEETKMLVNMFLETNDSDVNLSIKTGISSSTIGRRLTDEEKILKAFPENGLEIYKTVLERRKENLLKGKQLGGQTSMINHGYSKDENGKFQAPSKLRLDVIYRSKEGQDKFLFHSALTFRLNLKSLSELFQMDEKEIYHTLIDTSPSCMYGIRYLVYEDGTNQEEAKEKFVNYYKELLNAIRQKNIEEKNRLIDVISDKKIVDLSKRSSGDKISNEEIITILRYQLKYSLTSSQIQRMFNVHRNNLLKRVRELPDEYQDLKDGYEKLSDYNADFYKRSGSRSGR